MPTSPPAGIAGSGLGRLVAWYDRHRGGRTIVLAWLITRTLSLLILATKAERIMVGDVYYYWRKINAMRDVGLADTLNEYPTPVVWILWLPFGATGGRRVGYLVAFMALMLLLDAAFAYALYRAAGRRHTRGVDFWLLFVFLVGPLSYLRFDLIPAVLAGGALLAARRRPTLTGALTGLGAAVKLWPALLIGLFLAYQPDRKRAGIAFVAVGFGLAAVSLLVGGWDRLISPLTWQSGRGLQIESIWATPLMVARAVAPSEWVVDISRFQAYEIFGPGVSTWIMISNIATIVGLVTIVALLVRAFRSGGSTPVAIGFGVLAIIAIMIVTNKTLSPQYLLWLGGCGAAMLLLARSAADEQRRAVARIAVQLLVLAVATHLVYPLLYDGFLGRDGRVMIVVSTVATTIRNLAVVVVTIEVTRLAWRFLGDGGRAGTSEG
jgi:hypothetical protein